MLKTADARHETSWRSVQSSVAIMHILPTDDCSGLNCYRVNLWQTTKRKDRGRNMAKFSKDDLYVGESEQIKRRKARIRKNRITTAASIIACIVAFIVVMAASAALYIWVDEGIQENAAVSANLNSQDADTSSATYTQAELEARAALLAEEEKNKLLDQIAEGLNSGSTMVETLRPLYKDDIVVVSGGKFHFIPVSDTLKKHNYTNENLQIAENGELTYMENGQVITRKGIDVSKHNGEIDWGKVAADGVEFAFIRVGIRGYGSGKLVEDEGFEENVESALANGIKVGVYFFSQATTVEEAVEEAEFVKQIIAPYKIECPVVLDVEKVADSEARMNKISVEERTQVTKTFCEEIEKAGYKPMIYYNMEMAALMLDLEQLEDYDKWFAYYNKDIYFPYDFKIWQYTDKGSVDGIEGDVDLNIAFGEIWK